MKKLNISFNIEFDHLAISSRDPVATKYLGSYKSVFKGNGLEFEGYRKYSQDDDASRIDWKASRRVNQFMVREYTEERNLDVFFLIDVSNGMLLGAQPKLKCEYIAEVVSALSRYILASGDNVGFALFNTNIVTFQLPRTGETVHSELIHALSNVGFYGGGSNVSSALSFALKLISEGSLVILLSDFINMPASWSEFCALAGQKFSFIGMLVRDPIDRELPEGKGQVALADPYSNQTVLVDIASLKHAYAQENKAQEERLLYEFNVHGGDFVILQTNQSFIGPISRMFTERMERWR
ncbi:MAG TPA: DUF58 domain-containing protein [Candidatus Nanoarchaeia archaeon]|nr:DUF58 domain-containing protein [Candidatus Nanoarchaeia archaeon]